MKRAFFLLPLVLGTALWSVNWRLSHPPQTGSDQKFAHLVQDADEVEVSSCFGHKHARLKDEDLRFLVNSIHLEDHPAPRYSSCDARYTLNFKRRGHETNTFDVDFDEMGLEQTSPGQRGFEAALERHTSARLERFFFEMMGTTVSP